MALYSLCTHSLTHSLTPVLQADLTSSLGKVTEEREFLRSLNETLLSNQKDFNSKLAAAENALKEKDAQLQDLQEQVRFNGGQRGSGAGC